MTQASSIVVERPLRMQMHSLGVAACFIGLAALAVIAPLVPFSVTFALAGSIIAIAGLYLLLRKTTNTFDFFEIYVVHGVVFFLYFGFGALFFKFNPEELPSQCLAPYITPALLLGVLGFLSFTAGYGLCFKNVTPSAVAHLAPRGLLPFLVPGVLGVAAELAGSSRVGAMGEGGTFGYLVRALGQLGPLYLFAWFLVWHSLWSGHTTRVQNVVLLSSFVPMTGVVIFATMGIKSLSITLLLVPAIAYWYNRKRLPKKTLLIVLLIGMFVVFPIYGSFRQQNKDLPVARRVGLAVETATRWDRETFVDNSVMAFLGRFALITSPAAVLRETGRWVEFEYGRTLFLTPIAVLVPRFLWPDKPNLILGHEFGRTFHLLNYTDRETQIGSTAVGELYWNFHIPGVVFGMFCLGAAYRWIYRKFGEGGTKDSLRKAAYLMFLVMILHGDGSLAAWGAGSVRLVLIVLVFFWIVKKAGLVTPYASEAAAAAPKELDARIAP